MRIFLVQLTQAQEYYSEDVKKSAEENMFTIRSMLKYAANNTAINEGVLKVVFVELLDDKFQKTQLINSSLTSLVQSPVLFRCFSHLRDHVHDPVI